MEVKVIAHEESGVGVKIVKAQKKKKIVKAPLSFYKAVVGVSIRTGLEKTSPP